MWIGAEDDESLQALDRAIDLGVNFIDTALAYGDGHSEQLVGQRRARRATETVLRRDEDPAEEPALAGVAGGPRRRGVPRRAHPRLHRAQPAQPRPRADRRPAVPRLARRLARAGRLAGDGRGAQAGGQDPLLRRVDQRPRAGDRARARALRPRRHRAGDLQRLRPEPGGRALPARASSTASGCSRACRSTRAG